MIATDATSIPNCTAVSLDVRLMEKNSVPSTMLSGVMVATVTSNAVIDESKTSICGAPIKSAGSTSIKRENESMEQKGGEREGGEGGEERARDEIYQLVDMLYNDLKVNYLQTCACTHTHKLLSIHIQQVLAN